jgi:CRP/FNR family nitrogen fixation transcriptional regulator
MALPMSHRDIANYRGLTLKMVSRALSEFHRKGYLRFLDSMKRLIAVLNAGRGRARPLRLSVMRVNSA